MKIIANLLLCVLGPGRGIKIHTFLAFLFVILPNKHRPSFLGTFVIAIHQEKRGE